MSDGKAESPWQKLVRRWQQHRRIVGERVIGPSTIDPQYTVVELDIRFGGRSLKVRTRAGTTDRELINMILWRGGEYRLPAAVQPKVIFDIGANIGITALYYTVMYPEAEIFCFEPLPANVELLRDNARLNSGRIHVYPFGLADKTGTFDYFMSGDAASFGGGGFSQLGHDPARAQKLELRSVTEAMELAGVKHVDLFKVDTEGSEWPILQAIPEALRLGTQAFIGELHGCDDWQFIDLLSQSHAVGLHKPYQRNCFPFLAVRKDLATGQGADGTFIADQSLAA